MSAAPDLDELDAMLDATLEALGRRANDDVESREISFEASRQSEVTPPEIENLWRMIELARLQGSNRASAGDDEAAVSFAGGDEEVSPLVQLRQGTATRLDGLLSIFADVHVIETGQGPTRIRTQVGWRGDARSELALGMTAEQVTAHAAATASALDARARRLHGLAMVLSAASRIAALLSTPGAAVMALPIAYECVRALHRRWSSSRSNLDRTTRETP